jgi:hypothetical protein
VTVEGWSVLFSGVIALFSGLAVLISAVATLFSGIGVIAAICEHNAESRRERFSRGIDLLLRLSDEFWADTLRTARKTFAQNRLKLISDEKSQKTVLNFFEKVGYLQNHGALEAEAVWQFFSPWLIPYFNFSSALIAKLDKCNQNNYAELQTAYPQIEVIEENRAGRVARPITEEEFLKSEANYLPAVPPLTVSS